MYKLMIKRKMDKKWRILDNCKTKREITAGIPLARKLFKNAAIRVVRG